jgi:hypothetical protein
MRSMIRGAGRWCPESCKRRDDITVAAQVTTITSQYRFSTFPIPFIIIVDKRGTRSLGS